MVGLPQSGSDPFPRGKGRGGKVWPVGPIPENLASAAGTRETSS